MTQFQKCAKCAQILGQMGFLLSRTYSVSKAQAGCDRARDALTALEGIIGEEETLPDRSSRSDGIGRAGGRRRDELRLHLQGGGAPRVRRDQNRPQDQPLLQGRHRCRRHLPQRRPGEPRGCCSAFPARSRKPRSIAIRCNAGSGLLDLVLIRGFANLGLHFPAKLWP